MDARQAALFNDIDPKVLGQRLRAARIAAGMTQGQMSGGDVSVGYVSRIESGQRRPDAKVLEAFASRVKSSVDQLLLGVSTSEVDEVRLALNFVELSLESGEAVEGLRLVEELLSRPALSSMSAERGRGALLRARALESVGQLDDAIVALEGLALADGDASVAWLQSGIALCRCYRESGDLTRATQVGESILAKLAALGLEMADEAVQLSVTVAAAYFEQGDTGHAVRMCMQALAAADRDGSPRGRAAAYWNASMMESQRGSVAAAIPLAERALHLLSEGRDARGLARLRSQLGIMQLQLDPPLAAEALVNLERAAEEFRSCAASHIDIARNQVAVARALFLSGDTGAARLLAGQTYATTSGVAPLLAADARALEGQAAAVEGDTSAALTAYRDAILTLTGVGADRSAAQLWLELGGLLDAAGDSEAARDAYRSAAVSSGLRARRSVSSRL